MSQKGIEIMRQAFTYLQQTRHQLFELASGTRNKPRPLIDQQDVRFAHLLDEAKDAIKEPFMKALEEYAPRPKKRRRPAKAGR